LVLLHQLDPAQGAELDGWIDALDTASVADPDLGLEALCRLSDRLRSVGGEPTVREDLFVLLPVLGFSRGAVDFFDRHPEQIHRVAGYVAEGFPREETITSLISAADGRIATRIAARSLLIAIAAVDLASPTPVESVSEVCTALTRIADEVLQHALRTARIETNLPQIPLAVFAFGKTGSGELNYVSDVDIVFVCGDSTESEGDVLGDATRLARACLRELTAYESEPPVWEIDTNLRPEGKKGALVRTLSSYREYYRRWATNWEFQALLKARIVAGTKELGRRCSAMVSEFVWSAAERPNFIRDAQRMRRRVISLIPEPERERNLKLSAGGLRDVEFSAQLLQLVHGRTEPAVRSPATVRALSELSEHGFIGRVEARALDEDYRWLRVLEHHVQLRDLRRTHLLPESAAERRILSRAARVPSEGDGVLDRWKTIRSEVSRLQRAIFYQPLLDVAASLHPEALVLSPDQARVRLRALGFVASDAALEHIRALTRGVSRRAEIQRHLLPVLLEMLAEGTDPDYGLLAFRRLSERIGEQYWYLRMLRDSPIAAQHLCRVLSRSRYIGDALSSQTAAAAWVGSTEELVPRTRSRIEAEMLAIVRRHRHQARGNTVVPELLRAVRRRELLRLAMVAVTGTREIVDISQGVSAVHAALIEALLAWIDPVGELGVRITVIGLGRFGGGEQGFGSDLDLMFLCADAGAGQEMQSRAREAVGLLREALTDFHLPIVLDLNLRPEGRKGPLVRTVPSALQYYEHWSEPWEAQALLRACAVAGDAELSGRFLEGIAPIRYPARLEAGALRQIRLLKARMESERLPHGTDRAFHLKLGRGSLSDVEWVVQLLQLRHAAAFPELRVPGTMDALSAEETLGLLSPGDAMQLREAWTLASRIRSAIMLASGKPGDILPTGGALLDGVAGVLGIPPTHSQELVNHYLAVTRRSRRVFERLFIDRPPAQK
jgi:glutamate-ammonia-ligase adenylyltransferase